MGEELVAHCTDASSSSTSGFVVVANAILIFLLFSCNSPEGIETLCSDVGVDHTDLRILMLAW